MTDFKTKWAFRVANGLRIGMTVAEATAMSDEDFDAVVRAYNSGDYCPPDNAQPPSPEWAKANGF